MGDVSAVGSRKTQLRRLGRVVVVVAVVLVAAACSGDPDTTFDGDGQLRTQVGAMGEVRALRVLADGRIVGAGMGNGQFVLARYQSDGALDQSFGGDGLATVNPTFGGDRVADIEVVRRGAIVVAGSTGVSPSDFALARFTADGTPDSTFGDGGLVISDLGGELDELGATALQADGMIVAAGTTRPPGGINQMAFARYRRDGSLDPRFGSGGIVTVPFGSDTNIVAAEEVLVRPDGAIVAAGTVQSFNNDVIDEDTVLVQLRGDGSLDPGFGSGGIVRTDVLGDRTGAADAVLLDDGTLVVATNGAFSWWRPDGKLDPAFGEGGVVAQNAVNVTSLVEAPDGKLVTTHFSGFAVARFTADGLLDQSFGGDGIVTTTFRAEHPECPLRSELVFDVAVQSDGAVVAAGSAHEGDVGRDCADDFALARYTP
jgi:uncharacterized delta-60 repeat protein